MQPYLNIYVDNRRLDLPAESINLTLSYRAFDAEDLTPAGSNADRPITFDSTKENDAAFGSWYDVSLNNLQAAELKPAFIENNGITILTGKSKLIEATTAGFAYGRRGLKYKAAFFGDNGDWIQLISGLRLADLDWQEVNHIFTEDNVSAGLDADPDLQGYGYAIAKIKNWGFEDANGKAATVFDTVVFLFINTILDAIFTKYLGYTWNSNFFTKQANKRYILPCFFGEKLGAEYGADYLDVAAEYTVQTTYPLGADRPLDFDTQTYSPPLAAVNPLQVNSIGGAGTAFAGQPNVTTYTCPADGYYQFFIKVQVLSISVPSTITAVGILTNAIVGGAASTGVVNAPVNSYIEYTGIIKASAGDWVQPAIRTINGSATIQSGFLQVTGEAVLSLGFQIDFKYLLQDWTAGDFLKGLAEMFNLKFETNVPLQQVFIEPLDDYIYTQRTGIGGVKTIETGFLNASIDNTNKLDLSKQGTVQAVSNTARNWRFVYKEDSNDKTVEKLQESQEFKLYEANYLLPAGRFKEDEKIIENSFFAAQMHVFDPSIRAENSDFVPQVPLFWAEDYTDTQSQEAANSAFQPRLLWFGGKRGLDGIFNFYSYDLQAVVPTILPACFAVNYNDISGYDISLSYCSQLINENNIIGLTERYYLRTMARKRAGKIVQEWLHLKNIDILNLSFRNKLLLQGNEFLLLSVDSYEPTTNNSTKITLEYNQADEQADYDAFVNSPISGVYSTYIV